MPTLNAPPVCPACLFKGTTHRQEKALAAVRVASRPVTARAVALLTGRRYNSTLREDLTVLARVGLLRRTPAGYVAAHCPECRGTDVFFESDAGEVTCAVCVRWTVNTAVRPTAMPAGKAVA